MQRSMAPCPVRTANCAVGASFRGVASTLINAWAWQPSCINHHRRHGLCQSHKTAGPSSSSAWQEVSDLDAGKSGHEQLSSAAVEQVAGLVDVDRTGELLLWVWQSIFDRERPTAAPVANTSQPLLTEVATLGGGCFYSLDAVCRQLKGVLQVTSGYAGGHTPSPTHQQVCSGMTGHAEVVQVEFDPCLLSYQQLLQVFLSVHDPTSFNEQGADMGTNYRSLIVCHTPSQAKVVQQVLQDRAAAHAIPLVIEVLQHDGGSIFNPLAPPNSSMHTSQAPGSGVLAPGNGIVGTGQILDSATPGLFWPAEPRHQEYYACNPGSGYCVTSVVPKLQLAQQLWPHQMVEDSG